MKKKGLKEATQLYHVSSSPVHDTFVETSASPTNSPVPTPTGYAHSPHTLGIQDNTNHNHFHITTPVSDQPSQTSRVTPDRLSPRVELVLGPPLSTHASGGSSKWRDRTADWVEMVERSGLGGFRGGDAGTGNSFHKNPHFRRTSSFNDTKPQPLSSAQFRERSMTQVAFLALIIFLVFYYTLKVHLSSVCVSINNNHTLSFQVGSRTLPEGSCWTKGGRLMPPYHAYPIPEHGPADWTKSRAQRKPCIQTVAPSHSIELKHTGTNTNIISVSEKHAKAGLNGTWERQRNSEPGTRGSEGMSGIGGPAIRPDGLHGLNQMSTDRAERAEQNWNRRGPSPIQRNMLARKLKEAQSRSGIQARQRSSTFSVSSSEQRRGRCRSLPMSGDYSSGGSSYRLSEAEQKMLDLDLSSPHILTEK